MTTTTVEKRRARPSMNALVFDGKLTLGELPRPVPGPDQLLVRVDACGISRRDVDFVQHRRPVQVRPTILGHEFVGRVTGIGDRVDASWTDTRVIARPMAGCGRCISCRKDHPWLCELGPATATGMGLVDGAFADYVVVPVRSVLTVPTRLDDEEAVFAYPVSHCLAALEMLGRGGPHRVLVVGDGNLGLLATLMLHAAGHSVTVLGRHPSRRDLLWRSGIGFTAVTDEMLRHKEELPAEFDDRFPLVVECSGQIGGLELGVRALRPRGRLLLLSDNVGQPGVDVRWLMRHEYEVIGIGGGPLRPALEYLDTRVIDILPLVSQRVGLDDGVRAFDIAQKRGTLRTILLRESSRE